MLLRSAIVTAFAITLSAPIASAQKRTLEARGPVACRGIGKKVIKNAIIRGDDYAVAVFGTCKIIVKDSHLIGNKYGALNAGTGQLELINTTVEAREVAVGLTGTGMIKLRGSSASGGKASVELSGTGKIKATKTVFRGRKIHQGLGKLELGAQITWEKGGPPPAGPDHADVEAPSPPPPPAKLRRHKAIRCDSNQRVELDGVIIDAPIAVMASGSCRVRLRNSELVGGQVAVMASGGSDIELVNTAVRSPRGLALSVSGGADVDIAGGEIRGRRAYDVSGGATVSAKNVTVRGRGTKSRTATFKDRGGNRFLRK